MIAAHVQGGIVIDRWVFDDSATQKDLDTFLSSTGQGGELIVIPDNIADMVGIGDQYINSVFVDSNGTPIQPIEILPEPEETTLIDLTSILSESALPKVEGMALMLSAPDSRIVEAGEAAMELMARIGVDMSAATSSAMLVKPLRYTE